MKDAVSERNVVKKGKKFEYFFECLMAQQQGFSFIGKHCRSDVGEIDYVYLAELRDHPLWRKYSYLFIECKNWREKIGSKEMNHFIGLLKPKNVFPCCGVYITTSAFSQEALEAMKRARNVDRLMIIPIAKNDLAHLLDTGFKVFVQEKCDEILRKA